MRRLMECFGVRFEFGIQVGVGVGVGVVVRMV